MVIRERSVFTAPGFDPTTIAQPPCSQAARGIECTDNLETRLGILQDGNPRAEQMTHSYRNGCYQHIMFLGICGFVICNHIDREILVMDPWPTHHSRWTELIPTIDARALEDGSGNAKLRLAELAGFLRNAVDQAYTLSGILLSHMHFDHADDVVYLLELLAADTGQYTNHRGIRFTLDGPPVRAADLPRICCDYDALIYLLTYGFYVPCEQIEIHGDGQYDPYALPEDSGDSRRRRYWYGNDALKRVLDEQAREAYTRADTPAAWHTVKAHYRFIPPRDSLVNNAGWLEISAPPETEGSNGASSRLHYDDSFNETLRPRSRRCKAGRACNEITLGHFQVTPYVWDHLNTGLGKLTHNALNEQNAGALQRISAFLIKRDGVENAKKTFIVGSSGEMNRRWTNARLENMPNIETDLLIHAITRPHPLEQFEGTILDSVMNFSRQIDAYIEFMVNHITANDAMIFAHFEEFVREIANRGKFIEDFYTATQHNLQVLRETVDDASGSREEGMAARLSAYNNLFEENRFYVLGRRGSGFEIAMPGGPNEFRRERNPYVNIAVPCD